MQFDDDSQKCLLRPWGRNSISDRYKTPTFCRNRFSHRIRFETERTYVVPNSDTNAVNERHGVQMEELNNRVNDSPNANNNTYTNPSSTLPQTEPNGQQQDWWPVRLQHCPIRPPRIAKDFYLLLVCWQVCFHIFYIGRKCSCQQNSNVLNSPRIDLSLQPNQFSAFLFIPQTLI
jgi:hypothetical protein